jgi:hypothetical protein
VAGSGMGGRTGSPRSFAATTVCGPACAEKPFGFLSRPPGRAQEQPGTRAIRVEEYRGGRHLGSLRRNAGELTSVERQRDERVGPSPFPGEGVHVRGCTGAWSRAKACACTHRGQGHGDCRDHGGDARPVEGGTEQEGRTASRAHAR